MSNRQQLIAFLFNILDRWIMDNSKKTSMDKKKEEAPLLLPTPFPMYPFRDDYADFIEGIGDYLLSGEDYIALRDTVGFPPNKSKLKVFLVQHCNIPDPADYSFSDITETLRFYLEENVNDTLNEQKQPDDLITLSVAIQKYSVSKRTLLRAIDDNRIKSSRPVNAPSNSPHKISEAEVAKNWPLKG